MGGDSGDSDYNSTLALTDVIDSGTEGDIKQNGLSQSSLIYLLNQIITQINALNAKLDADGGVTDENYAATWNVSDTVDETGTYEKASST